MSWTEATIQKALTDPRRGFVPFTRNICVPNVSWGADVIPTGEADLIAVSKSGYVKEIEVKISVADLKRDKEKEKHKFWDTPSRFNKVCEFWYAMPKEVADAVTLDDHIPPHAGVIEFTQNEKGKIFHSVTRKATRRKIADKLTDSEMLAIARLGCIRYWSRPQPPQKGRLIEITQGF